MTKQTKKLILLLVALLIASTVYISIVPAASIDTYKETYSWVSSSGKNKKYTVKVRVSELSAAKWKVDIFSSKKKVESFTLTGKKPKVKFINAADLTYKKLINRKGKNIVYIERCTGVVTNKPERGSGRDSSGYYIFYGRVKGAVKNTTINSYFIYNPLTSAEDDITCRLDYKIS